jgi:hypothetical protein
MESVFAPVSPIAPARRGRAPKAAKPAKGEAVFAPVPAPAPAPAPIKQACPPTPATCPKCRHPMVQSETTPWTLYGRAELRRVNHSCPVCRHVVSKCENRRSVESVAK